MKRLANGYEPAALLGMSVWQNIANKLLEISIENESLRSIKFDVSKIKEDPVQDNMNKAVIFHTYLTALYLPLKKQEFRPLSFCQATA